MDLDDLKKAQHTVTGMKQTVKAIESGKAVHVFIAKDADERVSQTALTACERESVPVTWVETMEELGKASNIKVKAAMSAIILAE